MYSDLSISPEIALWPELNCQVCHLRVETTTLENYLEHLCKGKHLELRMGGAPLRCKL